MAPQVSVIMPTYNYGRYIQEALTSIQEQTFQDYEVVVIDDGSTDNTREIVTKAMDGFGGRLRYVYQNNQGVAVARNEGLKLAAGEYIAFLDADDVWFKTTLQQLVDALTHHNKAALVYANVQLFDHNLTQCFGTRFGKGTDLFPFIGKCPDKLLRFGNFIPMDAALIRREVFNVVGLFNKMFKSGEDLDMWLRITAKYEIIYLDCVLTKLRTHSKSLSFKSFVNAKAELLIIKRTLRRDPSLMDMGGESQMWQRMYELYYRLGIFSVLEGKRRTGRICLSKALTIDGNLFQNKLVFYFLISFLPLSDLIRYLRKSYRKVSGKT